MRVLSVEHDFQVIYIQPVDKSPRPPHSRRAMHSLPVQIFGRSPTFVLWLYTAIPIARLLPCAISFGVQIELRGLKRGVCTDKVADASGEQLRYEGSAVAADKQPVLRALTIESQGDVNAFLATRLLTSSSRVTSLPRRQSVRPGNARTPLEEMSFSVMSYATRSCAGMSWAGRSRRWDIVGGEVMRGGLHGIACAGVVQFLPTFQHEGEPWPLACIIVRIPSFILRVPEQDLTLPNFFFSTVARPRPLPGSVALRHETRLWTCGPGCIDPAIWLGDQVVSSLPLPECLQCACRTPSTFPHLFYQESLPRSGRLVRAVRP
ncbi:hypothetical protein BDZ88DRAFT_429217 [Geranomyces variabilis]|nr:hypothetical protein BDZ88DRAFT_429217 [Geranomyces variabilis]